MTTDAAPIDGKATIDGKVWDLALRAFHWSIVALIPLLWWSAENDHLDWHRRFGLIMLGLVVFRLYWGVAGTRTARFSSFVKGPAAIRAYLKKLKRPYAPATGHNPLGALSVIALLAALSLQASAGLFAVDVDGIESGPLSHLVSFEQGRAAAEFHETNFKILAALIALHLGAIAYYHVVLRANLVTAMITGKRPTAGAAMAFPLIRFVIGVIITGGAVALVVR